MVEATVEIEEINTVSIRDQLTKLVLGTVAGFLTSKLVEAAYDKFVIERRLNR